MKVKQNTPDLLILEERPWLLAVVLMAGGLAFLGAGLAAAIDGQMIGLLFVFFSLIWWGVLYLFVQRTQVVFNGLDGWVEIRSKTLLGYSKTRHDIAEIERAIYQSMSSDGGKTHRVALVVPNGQSAGIHPVTRAYTGGGSAMIASNAINTWLTSFRSDQTLDG